MKADATSPAWLAKLADAYRPPAAEPEPAEWVFDELSFVRREAQADAELAYRHWSRQPSRAAFAVYRAAQDRADAAQDELARWVARAAG